MNEACLAVVEDVSLTLKFDSQLGTRRISLSRINQIRIHKGKSAEALHMTTNSLVEFKLNTVVQDIVEPQSPCRSQTSVHLTHHYHSLSMLFMS